MNSRNRRHTESVGLILIGALVSVLAIANSAVGLQTPISHSSHTAITAFNVERVANGLPPVAENPTWSANCELHNAWMELNGTGLTHTEVPGTPGYADGGAWAGNNSVLAATFWSSGNPWRLAPMHLSQMMDPRLQVVGAAESHGASCLTTWPGYDYASVAAGTFTWFPGQNSVVVRSETAAERPTTPQTFVGIPDGAATGPYLYLYYSPGTWDWNARPTVLTATLFGPDGPESIAVVTEAVAAAAGYGGYMPTLAIFIPRQPLRADANYRLDVSTPVGATSLRFTTTAASSDPAVGREGQRIAKLPRRAQLRRTVVLPARTDHGISIKWRSLTRRRCHVVGGRYLVVRRVGTCRLRATAPGTATVADFSAHPRLKIVRSRRG